MIDQSNDGSPRGLKETERELLQSMVIKLSATACKGILRRAERRGKTLPTMLRRALEQAAGVSPGLEKPAVKIP